MTCLTSTRKLTHICGTLRLAYEPTPIRPSRANCFHWLAHRVYCCTRCRRVCLPCLVGYWDHRQRLPTAGYVRVRTCAVLHNMHGAVPCRRAAAATAAVHLGVD